MATLAELEARYFPPHLSLGVPHANDTMVTPHVDGTALFGAIADVVDTFRGPGDRLYITAWYLDLDVTLRTGAGQPHLGSILLGLAAAGADVRVIAAAPRLSIGTEGFTPDQLDWWIAKSIKTLGGFVGFNSPQANVRAIRRLRATPWNGPPPLAKQALIDWGGRIDSRHEKCVIAYSATTNELHAFVSGLDLAPFRLAEPAHVTSPWHDAGVELQGAAAVEVLENFRTRWEETVTLPPQRCSLDGVAEPFNPLPAAPSPSPAPAFAWPPATVPAGAYLDASVRVLRSYDNIRVATSGGTVNRRNIPWETLPSTGVREIFDCLKSAFGQAQKYIYVEDQTANPGLVERTYGPHTLLFPELSAACRRGIKVILVAQGIKFDTTPKLTNTSLSPETKSRILDPLPAAQRSNLAVHYVKGTKVHAKLVLIDDEFVSIGSANLWDRSMSGTESEVNAAIAHSGGAASLVADLRVRLWREHLRVSSSPTVDTDLRDLSKSLGVFRSSWGAGVSFSYPNSKLVAVYP